MDAFDGLTLDESGCFTDWPEAIATWSGGRMAPTMPRVQDITIKDIARGLANGCRWNGQCPFYSVAEHSVHVSRIVPSLEALMHDASEGYLTDMSRPVKTKSYLGTEYLLVESPLEQVIATRFDLTYPWSDDIHRADYAMGFNEAKILVPHLGTLMPPVEMDTPRLQMWTPDEAYERFLDRFWELGGIDFTEFEKESR